jgi:hypothetical protein
VSDNVEPTTIGSPLGDAAADDAGAEPLGEAEPAEADADADADPDAAADGDAAPLALGLAVPAQPARTMARTATDVRTRIEGILTFCTSR